MEREANIQKAIEAFDNGEFTSKHAAAVAHGVDARTVERRRRGNLPHYLAHQNQQLLNPFLEQQLLMFLWHESLSGSQPNYRGFHEMVNLFLRAQGRDEEAGINFIINFRNRHPEVKAIWSRKLEISRFVGMSQVNLMDHFYRL